MRAPRRRVPEHVSTQVRKVEPVSGGMVRLYFTIERDGEWDDQFTVLMPGASLPNALGFVVASAREIAGEAVEVASETEAQTTAH